MSFVPSTPGAALELIESPTLKQDLTVVGSFRPPGILVLKTLQTWLALAVPDFEPLALVEEDDGDAELELNEQALQNVKRAVQEFRSARGIREEEDVLAGPRLWNALEDELSRLLPPDPFTLSPPPLPRRSDYADHEQWYNVALADGLCSFGFPVQFDRWAEPLKFAVEPGSFSAVPPGRYTVSLEDRLESAPAPPAVPPGVVLGGVEASIEAPPEQRLILSAKIPEADSLAQAIKLFQALCVRQDAEDSRGRTLFPHFITGRFEDSEHASNCRIWDRFESTWGIFYGAAWRGAMLDVPPDLGHPREYCWGQRETIDNLHRLGRAYLVTARDVAVQVPIAVRYLSRPLGGRIPGAAKKFSQTGWAVAFEPDDYGSAAMEQIVLAFERESPGHRLRVPRRTIDKPCIIEDETAAYAIAEPLPAGTSPSASTSA